jgi:DNA-binding FadR family transcriptional regulator
MMELSQIGRQSPVSAIAEWPTRDRCDWSANLWEAIEAREVLEQSLARLAAWRRTDDDRIELDRAVARMRAAGEDRDAFGAGDFDFHVVLSRAAHNDLLAQRLAALEDHVRAMIALFAEAAFRDGSVETLVDTHERLADAVGRADVDEAPQIVGEMMALLRVEAQTAALRDLAPPSAVEQRAHTSKGDRA